MSFISVFHVFAQFHFRTVLVAIIRHLLALASAQPPFLQDWCACVYGKNEPPYIMVYSASSSSSRITEFFFLFLALERPPDSSLRRRNGDLAHKGLVGVRGIGSICLQLVWQSNPKFFWLPLPAATTEFLSIWWLRLLAVVATGVVGSWCCTLCLQCAVPFHPESPRRHHLHQLLPP